MADTTYDVAIIGAGPGGYVAAIRAAQLGMKAVVVEAGAMGGVCLNVGCIPSKAFLHTAEVFEEARDGKRIGVLADNVRLDFAAVVSYKERVVKTMSSGVGGLLKKNKVDVVVGYGRLTSPTTIAVSGGGADQTVTARHIIVATGSAPRALPFAPFDEERILSSTGMLALKEVPQRLIVIGGGVIGVEMATAFHGFGAEVTILEALPRIVALADEEVSAELLKAMTRKGVKIMTNVRVGGVERTDSGVRVTYTDADGKQQTLEADKTLVAVARAPLTKDVGLVETGIALNERGYVNTNGFMQTNVANIYAIGDCAGRTGLAHVASAEGILAVEHIAGQHVEPINYDRIPSPMWCSPEVAYVGLTEAQSRERGYDVKVSKFPFAGIGKATILNERTGFVKIVAEQQYGEILGVHIIGPRATELIGEAGVALSHEATAELLVHTIHAHPTLYEAMLEAAHGLIDGAIHI